MFGIGPRASCILHTCSTTEPHSPALLFSSAVPPNVHPHVPLSMGDDALERAPTYVPEDHPGITSWDPSTRKTGAELPKC